MTADESAQPQDTLTPPASTYRGSAGAPRWLLPWLWIHILSLDAPIVAISWARLFAESIGIKRLLPGVYTLLFFAVWVIYLVDRLIDTAPWKAALPDTARHRFYRRFWWTMLGLTFVCSGVIVALTIGDLFGGDDAVPGGIVGSGLLLSVVVVVYFALRLAANRIANAIVVMATGCAIAGGIRYVVYIPPFLLATFLALVAACAIGCLRFRAALPREILCGVIFALGTALPVYWHVSDSQFPFGHPVFSLPPELLFDSRTLFNLDTLMFAILCALNCVGVSIWEKNADANGRDPNAIAQYAPGIERQYGVFLIFLFCLAISFLVDFSSETVPARHVPLAVMLSVGSLFAIHHFRTRLQTVTVRLLADIALLWPLLLIAATALR